jgi:glutamate racemase
MQTVNQPIPGNTTNNIPTDLIIKNLASPTLERLIEEVKNENQATLHVYDRVHNRHNR